MPYLYKKFFEQVPMNNITEFQATGGVNQIQFMIPAVQGATLSTQDLMLTGNLQVNLDQSAETAYTQANFGTDGISFDNVLGIHNIIDRVDLISMRGNTLIEQRLNYQLITKYQRGVQAESNLAFGRMNNQQACSSEVLGSRNFLGRQAFADDGQDFAIQLNTGLMKTNNQVLNLQSLGGLMIRIYLSEPINAFFNVDPAAAGGGSVIGNNFNYTLRNLKIFGRYNYMTNDILNQLSGVSYKKTDNLMSVVQSSNDTLTNSPQVMSLHKMIYVYQPNNETSNNKDVNNMSTNSLVGLDQYLLSMNGVRTPLDYAIDIDPSIPELPTTSGNDSRVAGNAEQQYLTIGALNDQYPPVHSLVNPQNQAQALGDQFINQNRNCKNVDVIGMNYSFNFEGYSVRVPNDMMSINVENSVDGSAAQVQNLPSGNAGARNITGQSATQNLFIEYDAQLSYSGMVGSS